MRLYGNAAAIVCILVILTACCLAASSLLYPATAWDTPTYMYFGRLLLSGGTPYKDALDTKGPGIFFIFAAIRGLLGPGILHVRVFDLLWEGTTALALGLIAVRVTGKRALGVLAGAPYLGLCYAQGYWNWTQPDGMLTLPIAICILALLRASDWDSNINWIIAGLAFGVALLFKITICLFLPVVVWAIRAKGGRQLAPTVRRSAVTGAGTFVPLLACYAYFQNRGAIAAFLEAQFRLSPAYAAFMRNHLELACVAEAFSRPLNAPVYTALFLGALALVWHLHRDGRLSLPYQLSLLWYVTTTVSVFLQTRLVSSHFMATLGPVAVLSAASLPLCSREKASPAIRRSVVLAWCAFALFMTAMVGRHAVFAVGTAFQNDSDTWSELGMKLRNATRSEQTIAVWGNVPAIYIHADRLSATPFLATFFVEAPLPGFDQHPAYLQNFRRNHPEFVVFVKNGPEGKCDAQNIDLPSAFWRFTALQEILKADYEVVEDAAAYTLFHRRPIASAASHSLRALAN